MRNWRAYMMNFKCTKVLLTLFWSTYRCFGADFSQIPTDVNVTLGEEYVTFHCQTNTFMTYWEVNGSLYATTTSNTKNGITTLKLTVPASEIFNNTVIQCVIDLPGGGTTHSTPPAIMRVQGLLEAVKCHQAQSSRNTIHLFWIEPHSLNITGTEPDVWYHINITKTTGSKSVIHFSIPSEGSPPITGSEYVFSESHPDPCSVYEFDVIPVNAVGEGKKASQPLRSSFIEDPYSISAEDAIVNSSIFPFQNCYVLLSLSFHSSYCPGRTPDLFHIYLKSVGSFVNLTYVHHALDTSFTSQRLGDRVVYNLSLEAVELVWGEKYSLVIEAENQVGKRNSTGELEIHIPKGPYLYDSFIEFTNSGGVCIACIFTSTATIDIELWANCTALVASPDDESASIILSTPLITVTTLYPEFAEAKKCFNGTLSEGNYTVKVYSELNALCKSIHTMELEIWISQTGTTTTANHESPTVTEFGSSGHPPRRTSKSRCSFTCIIGIAIGSVIIFITGILTVLCLLLWRKIITQGKLQSSQDIQLRSNNCYDHSTACKVSDNVCYNSSSAQCIGEACYEDIPS